mmetsp:Transcript_43223/g.122459  ORF Transcript_43223/g.122459 Transcript_43223/m.122459 type:complete len:161 (-) Transcript_43223:1591-2073(-)
MKERKRYTYIQVNARVDVLVLDGCDEREETSIQPLAHPTHTLKQTDIDRQTDRQTHGSQQRRGKAVSSEENGHHDPHRPPMDSVCIEQPGSQAARQPVRQAGRQIPPPPSKPDRHREHGQGHCGKAIALSPLPLNVHSLAKPNEHTSSIHLHKQLMAIHP